jgi:protein-S-isoprenylcysteine O-methyltransferase Ste14
MEHIKYKPISEAGAFVHAIAGVVIAALVMLGVGGTVYNLVAPGGWIARAFDRSLAGGMGAILALLIIPACVWMTRTWISVRRRNRHPEVFVYGFALVGAIYAIQFVVRGGF